MVPVLSPTARVAKFFAQQYRGSLGEPLGVPRKRLVKLLYMSDVLARQYLGHPLSELEYRKDTWGPYDPAIKGAVRELCDAGLAREEAAAWRIGDLHKRLVDLGISIPFGFDIGESAVLAYVVKNYVGMPMQELVDDVVYQSEPMRAVHRQHERLPMEVLDHAGTRAVGFDILDVLKSVEEGRRGHTVELDQFLDELHAKADA